MPVLLEVEPAEIGQLPKLGRERLESADIKGKPIKLGQLAKLGRERLEPMIKWSRLVSWDRRPTSVGSASRRHKRRVKLWEMLQTGSPHMPTPPCVKTTVSCI